MSQKTAREHIIALPAFTPWQVVRIAAAVLALLMLMLAARQTIHQFAVQTHVWLRPEIPIRQFVYFVEFGTYAVLYIVYDWTRQTVQDFVN